MRGLAKQKKLPEGANSTGGGRGIWSVREKKGGNSDRGELPSLKAGKHPYQKVFLKGGDVGLRAPESNTTFFFNLVLFCAKNRINAPMRGNNKEGVYSQNLIRKKEGSCLNDSPKKVAALGGKSTSRAERASES